jgi:hypothetical protein
MGWNKLESRIEQHKANLARNPSEVAKHITEDLNGDGIRPRDAVRLLCTRASARRHLIDYAGAHDDLADARRIPKSGAIARCEISVRTAELYLTEAAAKKGGWNLALGAADEAILTALQLKSKFGKTEWAKRQTRTRASLLSAAYNVRAQIFLYGFQRVDAAFQDAINISKTAPRYQRRPAHCRHPQIPACSVLAACATKGGNSKDLEIAIALVDGLEKNLPIRDAIPRAQIRATRGCIFARTGQHAEAEILLRTSLDDLEKVQAWTLYGHILSALLWVVRDCQQRPERAEFLAQQYQERAPAVL